MAIYKMVGNKEDLISIDKTSFGQQGVFERWDLQRILRDRPEILEEGLFIVSEEFSNWQSSGRSIDLLGIDRNGSLVVIELKRGETGEHMDLQAIRYAAMVSAITLQQTIEAHRVYLNRRGIEEDAEERLKGHLENPDSIEFSSKRPRIFLVSEGFSSELTTCALWLNDNGLSCTCIRMQPYTNDGQLLVETSQIIPLPEAESYIVKVRERGEEVQKQQSEQPKYMPGGDTFKQSFDRAPEKFRKELYRLHAWAVSLEEEGLVYLDTRLSKTNSLRPLIPNVGSGLVTVYSAPGGPYIQLWRGVFQRCSPNAIPIVERLLEPDSLRQGTSKWEVSNELLAALTEAYREANGLPVGDEAPDG